MSVEREELEREYVSAMRNYVRGGGEPELSLAYEIGRRALGGGLGILDIVAIHEQALDEVVLLAPDSDRPRFAAAAVGFCRELLSPCEMTLRGYQQANEHLKQLNETLAVQKREVELANRELESFSYSVSHDLRAPLRSIDGFSQALLEDAADSLDEKSRGYLARVRHSAKVMAELIEHLLELARVTRSELVRSRVDLSSLAALVTDRLRKTDPGRIVDLVIEDGVEAEGDERLLELVLQNLIGNAWKFTAKRERGRIEFSHRTERGVVVYHVSDNGAGFDMAYAKKLFGAFQRLHQSSDFEGTGVGLATVQRIVRRHGGEVWADGEVGRGATFYFTLREGKP